MRRPYNPEFANWVPTNSSGMIYWRNHIVALSSRNDRVKVGLLHSLTGTMALSERTLLDTEIFAIETINHAGGVLGRQIEPIIADGASDPKVFAKQAEDLISDGVVSVFGCWTSASRKAVKAVVETAGNLLWYPVQYEGLEESTHIVYTGSCTNQQITPAVDWLLAHVGPSAYLIGSDYIFPRAANKLVRSHLKETRDKGMVSAECYVPLGCEDFTELVADIQAKQPSFVFNTLNGDSNLVFYRQLHEAGIRAAEIPVMGISVGETELAPVAREAAGHFTSWNYFQTLDSPENRTFLDQLRRRYGPSQTCSAPAVMAFYQIHLWRQAAEAAGSTAPDVLKGHLAGQQFMGPAGEIVIQPNHHVTLYSRIGRLRTDGDFDIVWSSPHPIKPLPWLGLEECDIPNRAMVIEALSCYPDILHHSHLLEREIDKRTSENVETHRQLKSEIVERERNERLYRSAIEGAGAVPYYRSYESESYEYMGEGIQTLTGYTPSEFTTELIDQIILEDIPMGELWGLELQQADRRMRDQRGTHWRADYRVRTKSGKERWLADASVQVLDDQGKIIGTLGILQDITDRKRIEQERHDLLEQVYHTQKLESLGVLAGGIAHDFNNILTAVLGNASLALSELSPESPARESVRQIETAAQRAAELARQMLAYSGKGRFVVVRLNLSKLVEEMSHLLEVSISKKAVLRYHFAENLPLIEGDATQIRQVIMNLITNASDAVGDRSGVITISTGAMEVDEGYLNGSYISENLPSGCYVYCEVSDTGCGMAPETIARIFDPFFTTKFTGRGLGLAAVLGIVRGHHGAIRVYSQAGKGSTIKVLFPCCDAVLPEEKPLKGAPGSWKGNGLVLVVDDEETVRAITKRILAAHGLTSILAKDGREGLDLFRERSKEIDLVLMDLTMPHMDGEEAFREMRRIHPGVRVILTSGYNEQDATGRFVGKGLAGFIQKPFTPAGLLEKLREVLEG